MSITLCPMLLAWVHSQRRAVVVPMRYLRARSESFRDPAEWVLGSAYATAVFLTSRHLRVLLAHREDAHYPEALSPYYTHAICLSGAFLPGQGAPMTMLLAAPQERKGGPTSSFLPKPAYGRPTLRVMACTRGEPNEPEMGPEYGKVWHAFQGFWDRPGEGNEFVRTTDVSRDPASVRLALGHVGAEAGDATL